MKASSERKKNKINIITVILIPVQKKEWFQCFRMNIILQVSLANMVSSCWKAYFSCRKILHNFFPVLKYVNNILIQVCSSGALGNNVCFIFKVIVFALKTWKPKSGVSHLLHGNFWKFLKSYMLSLQHVHQGPFSPHYKQDNFCQHY